MLVYMGVHWQKMMISMGCQWFFLPGDVFQDLNQKKTQDSRVIYSENG